MPSISIFDILTGKTLDDVTVSDLDSATGRVYVDANEEAIKFVQGVVYLSKSIEAYRTYAGGNLPIPELGGTEGAAIADAGSHEFGPDTDTEIWTVQGIVPNALSWTINSVPISLNADNNLQFPIQITKANPLVASNASGGILNGVILYFKVSL